MIKVFTGPMYSAKSNSLIEEYNKIWNKDRILCFKPSKDTREYSRLYSRNSDKTINAIVIKSLDEILNYVKDDTSTIFIDEVQFLQGDINVLLYLSICKNIDFYIAGLSLTSEQIPFGIMPNVLAVADEIVHLKASCSDCNKTNAIYTYCLEEKENDILVGSTMYIPLCRDCLCRRRKLYGKEN